MKILIIGKGGREHAILKSLKKSPKIEKFYCLPGNGGTEVEAENVPISEMDNENILKFVKDKNIDFVVVTPDNPLANGLVDILEKENISCFGPTKKAARIESSKIFAKELMKKNNIPTANYEIFENSKEALKYIETQNKYPTVIKADGLAFGKGVVVAKNFSKAEKAVVDMLEKGKFKESGKKILVEEFLEGTEVSILTFTDGKTIKPMISSQDHKRILENDEGENTGGMGVVAPNPAYTKEIAKICEEEIFEPTIKAMKNLGCPFKGCLYFGLMITKNGPKVIEYNCRFGDPETQAVLPLLKTDLFSIMEAINEERLESLEIEFSEKSSACVILASKGYPEKFETGFEIEFNDIDENILVFHSGTSYQNNKFKTNGGRVLSICSVENSLEKALKKAYDAADKIKFYNKYFRKDIGQKALKFLKTIF